VIDEIKKAFSAKKHAGIDKKLSLPRLMWQSVPYFTSLEGKARPPLTVYWSINSVCNMFCKMCDVGQANKDSNFYSHLRVDDKLHEIGIERYKGVIDELKPYKPMIAITATEPLLYEPLGEAIEYTRRVGMNITITTNGYLLSKRAEELAQAGLSRLSVSIDGDEKTHNAIRGRRDGFQKATQGIIAYKEACRNLSISSEIIVVYTITNMNFDQLDSFYDVMIQMPIDRIIFSYMNFVTDEMAQSHNLIWGDKYRATANCINEYTQPSDVDGDVLKRQIQIVKAKDKAQNKAIFLPDFTKDDIYKFHHEPEKFMSSGRCMVNWFIAEIISSGEVIPYSRCYYVPMGNINQKPFMDIWTGEKANAWRRELRKQRRFPACTRCDQVF